MEELKVRQLRSEWSGFRSWENWEARFWRGAGTIHLHSENPGPPRGRRLSERSSGRRDSTSGKLDLREYGQEGESLRGKDYKIKKEGRQGGEEGGRRGMIRGEIHKILSITYLSMSRML